MYSAYIGGLPHAFNIIDGCNGFAGTVAVLVCLIGATFGFLVWNYPHGNTFAGDGGPYVWGMVIAVAVVTLLQRHRVVSPRFPILLIYCVL